MVGITYHSATQEGRRGRLKNSGYSGKERTSQIAISHEKGEEQEANEKKEGWGTQTYSREYYRTTQQVVDSKH